MSAIDAIDAIDACVAGWADHAARTKAAKALGLAIDDTAAAEIAAWLAEANGTRKKYTLPLGDVVRAVVEASTSLEGIGVRHGGRGGKFAMTPSTLALAVKPAERDEVVLAIGTCPARSASPGPIWNELAPWQQDLSRMVAKTQVWAERVERSVTLPIVPKAKLSLRQSRVARDALLAEVLAHPDDDAPRLVYADWLTARGDPRGEMIAVQCALAAGSTSPALLRRETALRRRHGAEWMKAAKQIATAVEMRRGFVAAITTSARRFATKAGPLFEREPIEELVVTGPEVRGLRMLAGAPHLARLRKLELRGVLGLTSPAGLRLFQDFLRTPELEGLRWLGLDVMFTQAIDGAENTIFDGLALPALDHLAVRCRGSLLGRGALPPLTPREVGDAVWSSLATAKLPALRSLAIEPYEQVKPLVDAFPAATITPLVAG